MWPNLSTEAASALNRSHGIEIKAVAVAANLGSIEVPVSSGTVTSDATSQTRRTANVSVPLDSLWPASAFAALSPIGSEMAISYGIVLPSGRTEWVPLIRGPITSVTRTRPIAGTEALSVNIVDRSLKVAEARLDQAVQTVAGATTIAEISRLITDVLAVSIVDRTGSTKTAPQIEIERERWGDGIEKLADSIGAEVFADPTGSYFVIRNEPVVTDPVAWTITADERSVLVSQDDEYSRELVYNRVVASGQRTDGTPPVFAIASDTNPNSPTYINGPFGTRTRFYASPLLTTVAQCQLAANTWLNRVTGNHLNVTFSNITHPGLEAGDVIRLHTPDRDDIHIIDTVSIPLSPSDPQEIKTRSMTLPEESSAI